MLQPQNNLVLPRIEKVLTRTEQTLSRIEETLARIGQVPPQIDQALPRFDQFDQVPGQGNQVPRHMGPSMGQSMVGPPMVSCIAKITSAVLDLPSPSRLRRTRSAPGNGEGSQNILVAYLKLKSSGDAYLATACQVTVSMVKQQASACCRSGRITAYTTIRF